MPVPTPRASLSLVPPLPVHPQDKLHLYGTGGGRKGKFLAKSGLFQAGSPSFWGKVGGHPSSADQVIPDLLVKGPIPERG